MRIITAACIASALAASSPCIAAESHAPLSATERGALQDDLRKAKPGQVTVACGGTWCARLAGDVRGVFAAAGWKVTPINHGGLGIDGVAGLRVTACGFKAGAVGEAIRKATSRPVEVIDEGACGNAPEELFLVIGMP